MQLGIPVQLSPIQEADFKDLARSGCDILVVASYNHRIGDWKSHFKYAVNFHPSPLPLGRGPYPIVKAIRDRYKFWGVTCHKLSPEFDAGDILACERFPLSCDESHESLDLKTQMAAKRLAANVAARFVALWDGAQPQLGGHYWKIWTDGDKTINFDESVDNILLQLRSFGAHETFAYVNGFKIRVRRAIGWNEPHFNIPGTTVHTYNATVVVAAKNGYIALIEWGLEGAPAQLSQPFAATSPSVQQTRRSEEISMLSRAELPKENSPCA
jgi:methionyl-tRNA formyltransferase